MRAILKYYDLGGSELLEYADHSHDPDMWSHTFKVNSRRYVLVEVEAIGDDLADEEYSRLEEDLGISRKNMKLILPKLEQMHTTNNQAGIGIDGHRKVISQEEFAEYSQVYDETQASRYFPDLSPEEPPNFEGKSYRNPNGLDTETTWVLFELT